MKLKRTTQNTLIRGHKTDTLSQDTQLLAETSLLLGGTKEACSVQPRYKYKCDGIFKGRRVVTEVDGGTCYNIHELTAGSINYRFKKTSMGSVILCLHTSIMYEGWNFNSGNYLFTTDTK